MLDRLIKEGIKYVFVSNSDNLGATLDLNLLQYFADSGKSFVMEVRQTLNPKPWALNTSANAQAHRFPAPNFVSAR